MNTIAVKRAKKKKKKAEENYNHRFDWSSGNDTIHRKNSWEKSIYCKMKKRLE